MSALTTASLSVEQLAGVYDAHAREYYRTPAGRDTHEAANLADALGHAVRFAPARRIDTLNATWLRAVREQMIAAGLARSTINARINRIRRAVKWAVAQEHVQAAVLAGLQALEPLKRGRSAAREAPPVRPARETDVHAAAAAAPAAIATMIQVQWWTGMRPGEVVIMRAADIELLDDIWIFRPIEHKTQHHDQARVIPLGPRARSLLAPHMRKPEEAFLFPGVQREQWLFTHRRAKRYTTATYRQAVLRACARAGVARWTPLQLRHAAGTRLRQLMGLETARTVLGHAHASTTEIYAERDQQRAIDAMKLLG